MLRRLATFVLPVLAAAVLAVGSPAAAAEDDPASTAPPLPTAIVSMGDSYISGESAGSYEEGTDTRDNRCHRSTVSAIRSTVVDGIDQTVNLACSGALTTNMRLGGEARFDEPPQAEQLRDLLATHDVRAIIVSIGGNDLGFGMMIQQCLVSFLPLVAPCRTSLEPAMPAVIEETTPEVAAVLADVRAVMRDAGRSDDSYELVLVSYPSPVTERVRSWWLRLAMGCPFTITDLRYARATLTPAISEAWQAVAAEAGVRFLDLSRAMEGREVCARGATRATEWITGIDVDLAQIRNGVGTNLVQESLHPNARGHAQLGRCFAQFLQLADVPSGACLRNAEGNLDAVPVDADPVPAVAAESV